MMRGLYMWVKVPVARVANWKITNLDESESYAGQHWPAWPAAQSWVTTSHYFCPCSCTGRWTGSRAASACCSPPSPQTLWSGQSSSAGRFPSPTQPLTMLGPGPCCSLPFYDMYCLQCTAVLLLCVQYSCSLMGLVWTLQINMEVWADGLSEWGLLDCRASHLLGVQI